MNTIKSKHVKSLEDEDNKNKDLLQSNGFLGSKTFRSGYNGTTGTHRTQKVGSSPNFMKSRGSDLFNSGVPGIRNSIHLNTDRPNNKIQFTTKFQYNEIYTTDIDHESDTYIVI